jgi:nucleotidyltransferase substrate binding protein (TIGR01987 family)
MKIATEPLEKALMSLEEAWTEYQRNLSNTFVRDSVIQRFEYTFELSHKILRRFLAETETETDRSEVSEMLFNDMIRLANKRGLLLNDLETWDKYRRARNLTSRNYDEFNADHIVIIIPVFLEDVSFLLVKITEKQQDKTILLHIEQRHLDTILSILKNTLDTKNCRAWVYGSRVQGKSLRYSDVDIALDYNDAMLPETVKTSLKTAFEKSILPYSVDIVDVNALTSVFRAKIEKDFVKIL